ncbi:MAG: ester cyclase [Dehalococcoidia bacterium]
MLESNKGLVRRFYEAIDRGDAKILDEFIAPDYLDHNPPFPNLPAGRAGSREGFQLALGAFSDFSHEVVDQIAEGDKVVTRMRASGKHTGEFLGIPATGKSVTMTGIAVHRIADGKIAEHWSEVDAFGFFQQLGSFPPT